MFGRGTLTGFVGMDYFPYLYEKMVSRSTISVNRRKKEKREGKQKKGRKKTKENVSENVIEK